MKRSGFTLIEFLVYIALCMFLSYLLFSFVSSSALQFLRSGKSITRQVQSLLAFDLFIRDVRAAPSKKSAWHVIQPHNCVWRATMQPYDIGWSVKDDRLLRTTGQYDTKRGAWTHKRSELVLRGVTAITYNIVQENNAITAIHVIIEVQGEKEPYLLDQWITVRERFISTTAVGNAQ